MNLFFSDLHLGREPSSDDERLAQVSACVRHELGRLNDAPPPTAVFLGDTFDAFVDAPRRMPPVAHAWIELVKELREMGAAVRFLSGNHDRWHAGNLERHAGITPDRGPVYIPHAKAQVLVSHGDEADDLPAHERFIKRLSDTPAAHIAYRTALPFGAAQRVAAWASVRLATPAGNEARLNGSSGSDSHEQTVRALRRSAAFIITEKQAQVVVYGHAHQAELTPLEGGVYLNTGDWHKNRTYGVVTGTDVRLARWNGGPSPRSEIIAEHVLL